MGVTEMDKVIPLRASDCSPPPAHLRWYCSCLAAIGCWGAGLALLHHREIDSPVLDYMPNDHGAFKLGPFLFLYWRQRFIQASSFWTKSSAPVKPWELPLHDENWVPRSLSTACPHLLTLERVVTLLGRLHVPRGVCVWSRGRLRDLPRQQ